jgi:hypothetical protein
MDFEKTALVLRAAKSLIATPETWCRGASARNGRGNRVAVESPNAVQFCATGAVIKIVRGDAAEFFGPFHVLEWSAPNWSITEFNDFHSHSEVMAAFDRAIKRCEELK